MSPYPVPGTAYPDASARQAGESESWIQIDLMEANDNVLSVLEYVSFEVEDILFH